MIKFENTEINGFAAAVRGARNPMNSWDKSDSEDRGGIFRAGPNDLKLMKVLAERGEDHAKFARMITVTVDITAPLYWWKEFDTYKVGTVANSCSTMHKLGSRDLTIDDFSTEHLNSECIAVLDYVIGTINKYRQLFAPSNNKNYWWQMIQLLPTSYNQRRTVHLNYQVLRRIYKARRKHKLDEWRELCDTWIPGLPYADLLITFGDEETK